MRSNPFILAGPWRRRTWKPSAQWSIFSSRRITARQLDANVRQLIERNAEARPGNDRRAGAHCVSASRPEENDDAGRFFRPGLLRAIGLVFPGVPHGGGVLRMQVNANHEPEAIDGLSAAMAECNAICCKARAMNRSRCRYCRRRLKWNRLLRKRNVKGVGLQCAIPRRLRRNDMPGFTCAWPGFANAVSPRA